MTLSAVILWVSWVTGYPTHEPLPDIQTVTHEVIQDRICLNTPCPSIAGFRDGTIYLQVGLSEQQREYILAHEVVHWLQETNGTPWKEADCSIRLKREIEAYSVQYKYIREVMKLDTDRMILGMPPTFCTDEGKLHYE